MPVSPLCLCSPNRRSKGPLGFKSRRGGGGRGWAWRSLAGSWVQTPHEGAGSAPSGSWEKLEPRTWDGDIGPPGALSLGQLAWRPALASAGQAIRAVPEKKLRHLWSCDNSEQVVFFTLGRGTASLPISCLISHCTGFKAESRGQKAPVCDSLLPPTLRDRSLPPAGPDTLPGRPDLRDAIWDWHSKDLTASAIANVSIQTSLAQLSTSCYNPEENNNLLDFSDCPGPGKQTFTGRKGTQKKREGKTHREVCGFGPHGAQTEPAALPPVRSRAYIWSYLHLASWSEATCRNHGNPYTLNVLDP